MSVKAAAVAMEITVPKLALDQELTLARRVAGAADVPILATVLLEAEGREVRISATDLVVSLRCGCPAVVTGAGGTALDARRLLQIVKAMPGEEVRLSLRRDSELVAIVSEGLTVKMVPLPWRDFPTLPAVQEEGWTTLPARILGDLVTRTAFAIGSEDPSYRHPIGAAQVSIERSGLTVAATDGHRLSHARAPVALDVATSSRHLVPARAMRELPRLLEGQDSADVLEDHGHLLVRAGGRTLTAKLSEGKFPSVENLTKGGGHHVRLDVQRLAAAIGRASLFTAPRAPVVKVTTSPGQIEVMASSDLGECRDSFPVEYHGPTFVVGFNPAYLVDFLESLGAELLVMEVRTPDAPVVFRPEGIANVEQVYVVMPMRL